jgi:hypothetical protein
MSYTFDESRRKLSTQMDRKLEVENGRLRGRGIEANSDFDSDSDAEGKTEQKSKPKPKLTCSNLVTDNFTQANQNQSNSIAKPEHSQTIEAIMDNYKKPKLLRVNHRDEIKQMVQKVSRRIVMRSFSRKTFDESQTNGIKALDESRSLNRQGRPSILLDVDQQKFDSIDSSKESPNHIGSLRVYQGHDSPIRVKPGSSKFKVSVNEEKSGYMDQIDRLATPYLKKTPSSNNYKAVPRGSIQKDPLPPKSPSGLGNLHRVSNVSKPSLLFTEAADSMELTDPSNEFHSVKDKSTPQSRRTIKSIQNKERPKSYVDFGKITIGPHKDEVLSHAENHSNESRSVMSEADSAPKFGRKSPDDYKEVHGTDKTEKVPLSKLGARAKSHLEDVATEKPQFKPYQNSGYMGSSAQENRPRIPERDRPEAKLDDGRHANSSFPVHVLDVTLPTFDLSRFQFLLFSQQPPNKKAFKIFLKEIKQDLDIVKSISFKEPMVRKVIFTNVDARRQLILTPEKRILFLDLDETLIHTSFTGPGGAEKVVALILSSLLCTSVRT